MNRLNNKGQVDIWLIGFILMLLMFVGALGFGIWAFAGQQDYIKNVDIKVDEAVEKAREEISAKKDLELQEKEKEPLRTYDGPAEYGSLSIKYPKTWSVYADETSKGNTPISGIMNPSFVPGINSDKNVALKFEVLNNAYADEVKKLEGSVKNGKIKAVPYTSAGAPSIVGTRFNGEVVNKKQGSMILLPLRDKTIKLWTEATQFVPDFDNFILPNFNFKP